MDLLPYRGAFSIAVFGVSAHGATPHLGRDALVAASAIILELQTVVSRAQDPLKPLKLSVCTFDRNVRTRLPEMIENAAAATAQAYGCTGRSEYRFGPSAVINEHLRLNGLARAAAQKVMGDDSLGPLALQMGGEDFTILAESAPAVFGFLGIRNDAKGSTAPHHSPDFKVDEDVLPWGAGIYAQFALAFLAQA